MNSLECDVYETLLVGMSCFRQSMLFKSNHVVKYKGHMAEVGAWMGPTSIRNALMVLPSHFGHPGSSRWFKPKHDDDSKQPIDL